MSAVDSVSVLIAVMSLLGLVFMGIDKQKALKRKKRISENTFVLITLLYGGLGIVLGGLLFSHKTSKWSFQFKVLFAFVLNLAITWLMYSKIV